MRQLEEEMKEFPCAFTTKTPTSTKRSRLKIIQRTVLTELKNVANYSEEEINRKKNLLSWACFSLGDMEEAKRYNDEVIVATQYQNIASLGNRVFIMFRNGNEIELEKCKKKLKQLKENTEFETFVTDGKAEQAYYLLKIGGLVNLRLSTEIFSEAVVKRPDKYLWKYGLGLAYRRMTDPNVFSCTQESTDVEEIIKKAAETLFDVGENAEGELRAAAYAQLTAMRSYYKHTEYDALFRQQSVSELCENALMYWKSDADVLIHCGRSLKDIDVDRAIKLLEKGRRFKDNSTVYHHLGLCYELKAYGIQKSKTHQCERPNSAINRLKLQMQDIHFGDEVLETIAPEQGTVSSEADRPNVDSSLVQKSIECYRKAVEVSHGENLPAQASLACLLKKLGDKKNAVKQYNKITNSSNGGSGHPITLINAHEQAGLCYLEMGQSSENPDLSKLGKEKLTIAVGLAAELASHLPELKNCAQEVWQSFRALESSIESETSGATKNKELLKLLHLVRDHGRIVQVVGDILKNNEKQLDDPEVIKCGLGSYLELKQYENALTFLRLASMRPNVTEMKEWGDEMVELRVKVLLSTAFDRLTKKSDTVKGLFQETFQLNYGECFGAMAEDAVDLNSGVIGDVLILYDESHDSEEGYSETTKIVRRMQKVFSSIFGLETSINLDNFSNSGNEMELWLEEMLKYQILIVVLGIEDKDRMFEDVLNRIWKVSQRHPKLKVYVIQTKQDTPEIPPLLQVYECFYLEDSLMATEYVPKRDKQLDSDDVIRFCCDNDAPGVMRLFCRLIGMQEMITSLGA